MSLPIDDALPTLRAALTASRNVVLQAPPGAGKTTRVPLALLNEPWLNGRRIVMLEPRRLAARLAAHFMAAQLNERVGGTIGYRMRRDTRVGHATRIEVVTEGVFTRMLQDDPELAGTGLVIFDEFHERNLQSDVGLALCLDVQRGLRDDLRILAMSATLDASPVANYLGEAPIVTSEGRSYPVGVRYLPKKSSQLGADVAAAVAQALREEAGSILVFLPGTGEIRDVARRLEDLALGTEIVVAPLYGNLSIEDQERAIAPVASPRRKLVLATSIAETSVTIEGIRIVIDAGLMRIPRFDPSSAMTRLITVSVSQATATQRCGRAGRLEPGMCWRLWSESEQRGLVAHDDPEIVAADLAPLVLDMAQWGVTAPLKLAWLTPPPEASWNQARVLLEKLGALTSTGALTAHGRAMSQLGLHPRLSHMLLWAREHDLGGLACQIAALLEERDVFLRTGAVASDLSLRVAALAGRAVGQGVVVDRNLARRIGESAQQLARDVGVRIDNRPELEHEVGLVLAQAYPDRIAQTRGSDGRYRLSNGRGARLDARDALLNAEFIVVAHLDGDATEARIFLAARIERAELLAAFAALIQIHDDVVWDSRERNVLCRREQRLGALVLSTQPLAEPDASALTSALVTGVRELGLAVLPWTKESRALRARVQFLHRHADHRRTGSAASEWPDWSEQGLLRDLEQWLAPFLLRMRRIEHLERLDLTAVLKSQLSWDQQRALDAMAPTTIEVPSGSNIAVDYEVEDVPVLAVRLQELFGLHDTPRLAGGVVPVKLHLLSPAFRPVQVTSDLASFWRNTYQEVKKDLKGRYPKHYWPDDPYLAQPIRGSRKPRGQ